MAGRSPPLVFGRRGMDRISRTSVLPATVLLVEDEPIVARAMRRALERLELHVVVASSTGDGIIADVQNACPDVVLMDVGLGGEFDGITIAEEILVCEDVPVVLISGNIDDDLRRRAARCGAYGFLAKPAPTESIVATLQMAIYKHGELRKRERDARRFAQIFDAIDTAMIMLRDGELELMNRAASELTGTRLAEAKVRRPEWAERLGDQAQVIITNESNRKVTCRARRFTMPDGEKVVLLERVAED